ncbi:hypothetical protein [Sphingobacterium bovistauri]|uniref:Uncharacterized protein n=1 Tax=Sphingobacterium bovistauri TaxID=2781959 RepID=A0ABS7Z7K7_9SPHI|nr:hypothetical protein [Sphingobacterium bovistauri]MCA5006140.1 hypothetical protein [Sphingobacterium bovistauri]
MLEIKTLADQLREKLRTADTEDKRLEKAENLLQKEAIPSKNKTPISPDQQKVDAFFKAIEEFKLEATEKSMIRVDSRTINLLKRMKLAKEIDMNRFIVYALHQYISQHPWLPKHIQEILKNTDL